MRGSSLAIALALLSASPAALAQNTTNQAMVGKDEWLFYSNEMLSDEWAPQTAANVEAIRRFNRILADNGIGLAVAMVPMKARIYREHLPDAWPLDAYNVDHYDRLLKALQTGGVQAIDLNHAFLSSPKRDSDTPLFYRLDSHWSRTGALQAAETIKAGVEKMPTFGQAMRGSPAVAYTLVEKPQRSPSRARDLLSLLPPGSPAYAPESVPGILVQKPVGNATLTGDDHLPRIALVGSSYSIEWTGFADFLRYQFQRDVGNYSVSADRGAWVAMSGLLHDGGFQTATPKLILWEWPERDMHAGPDFEFREARYRMPSDDWLLAAAAAVQKTCPASPATVKIAAPARDHVAIDVAGVQPGMDFLEARVSGANDGTLEAELTGDAGSRRHSLPISTNGGILRLPLTANGAAVTHIDVRTGGTAPRLAAVRTCRHPRDYARGD